METATKKFDIRPFALPNTPANEVWFEQPRDITEVTICLLGQCLPKLVFPIAKNIGPNKDLNWVQIWMIRVPSAGRLVGRLVQWRMEISCYFKSPERQYSSPHHPTFII